MKKPTELADVGAMAVAWDLLRREALALQAERVSYRCEHEELYDTDTGAEEVPPCWKNRWQNQHGDDRELPRDKWCQPCLARQAVHEAYVAVVRSRGARLRQLQRRAQEYATAGDQTDRQC